MFLSSTRPHSKPTSRIIFILIVEVSLRIALLLHWEPAGLLIEIILLSSLNVKLEEPR